MLVERNFRRAIQGAQGQAKTQPGRKPFAWRSVVHFLLATADDPAANRIRALSPCHRYIPIRQSSLATLPSGNTHLAEQGQDPGFSQELYTAQQLVVYVLAQWLAEPLSRDLRT